MLSLTTKFSRKYAEMRCQQMFKSQETARSGQESGKNISCGMLGEDNKGIIFY